MQCLRNFAKKIWLFLACARGAQTNCLLKFNFKFAFCFFFEVKGTFLQCYPWFLRSLWFMKSKNFVACAQCMRTANDADFLELNSSKYIWSTAMCPISKIAKSSTYITPRHPIHPCAFITNSKYYIIWKYGGRGPQEKIIFLQGRLTKQTRELWILMQNIVDKTIRLIISGTVEFLSVSTAKILVNLFINNCGHIGHVSVKL